MTFSEMIERLDKGDKVRRQIWDSDNYIYKNSHDIIKNQEQEKINLEFTDYQAIDWEVYKEREYMSFGKAFEKMKEGHKIKHKTWGIAYIYLKKKSNKYKIEGHCYFPVIDYNGEKFAISMEKVLDNNWYVLEED